MKEGQLLIAGTIIVIVAFLVAFYAGYNRRPDLAYHVQALIALEGELRSGHSHYRDANGRIYKRSELERECFNHAVDTVMASEQAMRKAMPRDVNQITLVSENARRIAGNMST